MLTRNQVRGFWAAWAGWALDGMDSFLYALVLVPALRDLLPRSGIHADQGNIGYYGGILFAIFLLGWGFAFLWGPVADRFGRVRTLVLTILCYSLFTFLCAVAASVWQLALFRFLAGAGIGGEWTLGGVLVAEEWPESRRRQGAAWMHTGYYFGIFLAAIVNSVVGARYGWRAVFAVGGTPALLVAFIRYGVREPRRWQDRLGRLEGKWTAAAAFLALFSQEYRKRTVVNATLLFVSMVGLWAGSVYVPASVTYLATRDGYTAAAAARAASYATMLLSAGTILGCLLVPWLAERFGRRGALAFYFVVMFAFISLGFGYVFYADHALALFVLCLFFLGIGGANFAVYTLWLPEQYRTECRGSAFAFATSFGRFLAAGITFLVGAGVAAMHTIGTPVALTSVAFLAGLALLPLSHETEGKELPGVNLTQLFDLSFLGRRDAPALEFEGRTFTFGEIDTRSNRLAHLFRARGLKAGDRLSVYLANSVEMIDVYLACVKLGIIFVPINILYRDREMAHILRDAEPAAVVSDAAFESPVPIWNPAALTAEAAALSADRPQAVLDGDAPAGIIYTSGTTGASKGAVLSHDNFAANALNLLACWQIESRDRFLLALPLFHVHALGNGLHTWLIAGCRMRLLPRFESARAVETFLDFRPTLFFGVPTMYVRLLEAPPAHAREIGAFMRLFVSGSAPLSAQVLEEFRARFGHTILERYGMSETLMNIGNPYTGERRPGSVGLPFPGVSVRLLNPEGEPVADGETGEIHLKGPNVFTGYWRRDDATRQAFRDGWFRTGDLALRAPDGYYTLCGRRSDLIISGGFNIYPREIEEFLEEQEEVAEAAVVAVPDRVRGEIPVAYVVLKTALDPAALEERCRQKLASFKIPRAFHPVDRLPRNAMGKIQKHLLPKK